MAGYNHSNPQRVVYHATYPTPLAPSESLTFFISHTPGVRGVYSIYAVYTFRYDGPGANGLTAAIELLIVTLSFSLSLSNPRHT